jgi:prepilin peptidase dependent protein B
MRQKGFSLVEMMIALVLGMIVIGAALGVYIGTFSANSSQMKYSRLNNELRTVMTQITRDLRRAGYNNWTTAEIESQIADGGGDFLANPQTAAVLTTTTAQIRYDEDASGGAASASEVYGYQWVDTNGDGTADTIQVRTGAGGWSNLTDPAVIRITNFAITDISPGAISPAGAAADITVPLYEIEITGRLVSDATVQRSIRETVRVRNPILS